MAGKPYQSCLVPYESEIIALRRNNPPMPYIKIAEYMRMKHDVNVRPETIFYFIKVRVKGYKPPKYNAWDIKVNVTPQIVLEASSLKKDTVQESLKPADESKPLVEKPKPVMTKELDNKQDQDALIVGGVYYDTELKKDTVQESLKPADESKPLAEKPKPVMTKELDNKQDQDALIVGGVYYDAELKKYIRIEELLHNNQIVEMHIYNHRTDYCMNDIDFRRRLKLIKKSYIPEVGDEYEYDNRKYIVESVTKEGCYKLRDITFARSSGFLHKYITFFKDLIPNRLPNT